MATDAQIKANRQNCLRSTGPKTPTGKQKSRSNAVTHGLTARTVLTVLPHEDPKKLEARIQRALASGMPRNDEEVDLICRIERLKWDLDRAERVAAAHLAHRVRMATRTDDGTVSADELSAVEELGSKLFFVIGMGPGYADATPDEYPAVIVRRLEETAEGCRWLLTRWAQLLNVLQCEAPWGNPEIIRFVGLMGKRGIEAYFDPELNSLLRAFDQLGDCLGHKFWLDRRDGLPVGFRGGFESLLFREIATAPGNEGEALSLICSIAERHIDRLEKVLAKHKEIEAAEATERYDRAALDCSPAFERHRRHRSALHRELMQAMEALRKMRAEENGVVSGQWSVASENGESSEDGVAEEDGVASGQWSVASEDGETDETTSVVNECPFVGQDSNLVLDDSRIDKIGILSHQGMDVAHGVKTAENVLNEANLRSAQSTTDVEVKSSEADSAGGKRSQSGEVEAHKFTQPNCLNQAAREVNRTRGSSEGSGQTVRNPR